MSGYRLSTGGHIDRSRPLTFAFDGRDYRGYAGDTLASALLASGVMIFGRGFKFHRPRGLLSAGIEEPNALLEVGTGATAEPNARATMVPLREGLVARSQNAWPSREFDIGRTLDWLHPLLPAGFYNKMFMWPSWHAWEPLIRRSAGLGRPLRELDPDRYEHDNLHCDVLVIGGGAAGLTAAGAAGSSGARVVLVEQDQEFGGGLLWESCQIAGETPARWVTSMVQALDEMPEVRRMPATTAFGYYDHDVVTLHQRLPDALAGQTASRYWRVRARQVILASGAIEQPLVFTHNDLPGIMLASAVRHYLNRYAVAAGRRVVIATSNDSAYQTALDLSRAGVAVQAVIDSRREVDGELAESVRARGIAIHAGCFISDVRGRRAVNSVEIGRLSADGRQLARFARIECDLIAMSGGWQPTVHLYSQARAKLRYDEQLAAFIPDRARGAPDVVGAASGDFSLRGSIAGGCAAGERAATAAGYSSARRFEMPRVNEPRLTRTNGPVRRSPDGRTRRQWVDFQHDVTVSDLELAVREGFASVEHLKRHTTVGMSVDQGKTSNLSALTALAHLTDRSVPEVGTTTFRPPFVPVTLGTLAGRLTGEQYSPVRHLPAHERHRVLGAVFEDAGGWQRPICYPRAGETTETAIRREALAVRNRVGLFDSSPLGKIELRGADAGEFLHRFYINDVRGLPIGRVRYGLMLNENGVIIDDGTIARLTQDHYLVTTTSGNAGRIAAWLEEWRQCEWPRMNVVITPVTTQWATFTLSGPRARDVLARLEHDVDLSPAAFPHMSVRCGRLEGVPVRVYRVSFTGELAFEINVPAGYGEDLWTELMDVGKPVDIVPYGVETTLLLRMEKGYLHVGTDTDGTTTPDDIGWGHVADGKRDDFIGRRSLQRPANRRPDRLQFVGLTCSDGTSLRAGTHLRLPGTTRGSDGWVTSAAMSPILGKPIALAMLRAGREQRGRPVSWHDANCQGEAQVVTPVFYDPNGDRLRA